ncbi:DUF2946 family protein [Rhodoferax sp.]|uniref:DUF2946 family protein n=1 Tax=Rhodoferax sp. TaxID=50421 RepID=UPI0026099B57|nr:DUF2946 family protein [Rhodoferax sp.]MDD2810959.1 DUF2946 family protein [Rhodoferax sp.]MDD4942412.1 DUF2946 family protein [Rhodoferax sp.]MDD5479562.1 DUF2946 family protein [Rhodoferax sp.]
MTPTRQPQALARSPWVLWLAVWLALFGALAPTVSHALQWARAGTQAGLVEICTTNGPRWMALPASLAVADAVPIDPASSTPLGEPVLPATLEHCPFCLLMAESLAPPTKLQVLFLISPGHAVVPEFFSPSFLPAQITAAAHPRGPPAL